MTIALLLATALAALPAQAQPGAASQAPTAPVDARWASWLGCWQLESDPGAVGMRVCITPDRGRAVAIESLVGVQRGAVDRIFADGVARPVSDPGCRGTERAEWSSDGERVFRFTEVTCGDEGTRTMTTLSFLSGGPSLVRVQVADAGLSKSVRVQRFRRAFDQKLADGSLAPQPARRLAGTSAEAWSVDDVIEASRKLPADAVQAALIEVSTAFALNKKILLTMADAGVQPGIIDLMVALAYPRKLEVAGPMGASSTSGIAMGGWYDPFYSPIVPAAYFFADCYSPFSYLYWGTGLGCRPYYSAYGYYGYYPYDGRYPTSGNWVTVDQGPNSGPGDPARSQGRVVNGRGYTQVRRPESGPTVAGGRGDKTSGGSGGSTSSTPGGVSSGGYSSGSSSGGSSGGGRVAVPRPE